MCYRSLNKGLHITPRSISGLFHFTQGYSLYTAAAVSAKEFSQYLENLKRQAEIGEENFIRLFHQIIEFVAPQAPMVAS